MKFLPPPLLCSGGIKITLNNQTNILSTDSSSEGIKSKEGQTKDSYYDEKSRKGNKSHSTR